jgi:CRP-like cAMP-binding protein
MSDRSSRIRSALLAVDWIAGAGEEVVEALAAASRWVHLRKDEALFEQGQMFLHIAVIASGFIESSLLSRDGRQCMTSIMGRGQVLGFNGLFLEHPAQGNHVATENTEVVLVPGDVLLAQMQRSAVLMRGVLREQSRRIEHQSYLLVDRQLQSHRVRIARALIMLWAYYEPTAKQAGREPELRLSQQRLADLTALPRQAVGGALKQLQADGLVEVRYSSIALRNLAGLQAIVDQES